MTDQEHKALRNYCAFILKEYGFQFSPTDPVIPALFIIHREMQLNNQNNKAIANLIKDASLKMNSKTFNFHSPGEAWKFQMAGTMKWFSFGLLILLAMFLVTWIWSVSDDVSKARDLIQGSERVNELLLRVDKDLEGYFFLDFKEASGNSIKNFVEYEKRNSKTVRVYLGEGK